MALWILIFILLASATLHDTRPYDLSIRIPVDLLQENPHYHHVTYDGQRRYQCTSEIRTAGTAGRVLASWRYEVPVLVYLIFHPLFLPVASALKTTCTWWVPVFILAGGVLPQNGPYSRISVWILCGRKIWGWVLEGYCMSDDIAPTQ